MQARSKLVGVFSSFFQQKEYRNADYNEDGAIEIV